ncbi:MAG: DUF6077 domain-containing protein [Planctomycetota bacterium]
MGARRRPGSTPPRHRPDDIVLGWLIDETPRRMSTSARPAPNAAVQPWAAPRAWFVPSAAAGGIVTIVTQAAQAGGTPFAWYAIGAALAAVVAGALALRAELRERRRSPPERLWSWGLAAACVAGAALALWSHWPNSDDALYVPNVVRCVAYPDEPMGVAFHYFATGGTPFGSAYWGGSHALEYAEGAISHLTGIPLLAVRYHVAPVLFGAAIPLASHYVLTRLGCSRGPATVGAWAILLSLLLLGEQLRGHGNLAFNRIYQGKAVMFSVGIPLLTALSIDYYRAPSWRTWTPIATTITAMIGLSISGTMVFAVLGGVLALAGGVAYCDRVVDFVRRGTAYLGAMAYALAYGVVASLTSKVMIGADNPLNENWPDTFAGHVELVTTGWILPSATAVATLLGVCFAPGRARIFLLAWALVMLGGILNAWIAPTVMQVTSQLTYWRLVYLYPMPLVFGLSAALAAHAAAPLRPHWRAGLLATGAAVLIAPHFTGATGSVFRRTEISTPRYKIQGLAAARALLDLDPPAGPMLAPPPINLAVPMLSADHPQLAMRVDGLRMWESVTGERRDAMERLRALVLLGGRDHVRRQKALEWLVTRYPEVRSVVATAAAEDFVHTLLLRLGYEARGKVEGYVLYTRSLRQTAEALGGYAVEDPETARTALDWYQRAAQTGDAAACYALAVMTREGRGTTADPAGARAWLERAAEGGDATAILALADELLGGDGTDVETALRWLRRGADAGITAAAMRLGDLYAAGALVTADAARAASWYERAGALGDEAAPIKRGALLQIGSDALPRDLAAAQAAFTTALDVRRTRFVATLGLWLCKAEAESPVAANAWLRDRRKQTEWLRTAWREPVVRYLLGNADRTGVLQRASAYPNQAMRRHVLGTTWTCIGAKAEVNGNRDAALDAYAKARDFLKAPALLEILIDARLSVIGE